MTFETEGTGDNVSVEIHNMTVRVWREWNGEEPVARVIVSAYGNVLVEFVIDDLGRTTHYVVDGKMVH